MFATLIEKWKRFLREIRYPLPNPEKEADRFFDAPLHHLMFGHIQEIVRFIIDEARKSREFGLYIERDHLIKEELFFLAAINALGGVWHMRRCIPFEEARSRVSELMFAHFIEELRYYFEQSRSDSVSSVRNRYNCHLESVLNRLLHEIYNVPNKAFYTT